MRRRNPPRRKPDLPPLLPEGVIEKILLKSAVKSLLRFRCVSRSWLSLIKSDRFIKLHLKTSTQNTILAHHRVVFIDSNEYVVNGCSLPSSLKWTDGSPSSSLDDPTNTPPKFANLLGCCNGVLCLLSDYCGDDDDECFSLWNPATKAFIELPKLGRKYCTKLGFGWDESSGAFKVFASVCDRFHEEIPILGHVYSSKTSSWKAVPMGSRYFLTSYGVFVCGRLHWVIYTNRDNDRRLYAIESFDLENEEFGRIELPPFYANANASEGGRPGTFLGEIGGCLGTLFDYTNRVDVWVMKEYGVKDSWFKVLTFPLGVRTIISVIRLTLPGEGPNGEIFIHCGRTFVVMNSTKGNDVSSRARAAAKMDIINNCYRAAGIYVESLVSPTGLDY